MPLPPRCPRCASTGSKGPKAKTTKGRTSNERQYMMRGDAKLSIATLSLARPLTRASKLYQSTVGYSFSNGAFKLCHLTVGYILYFCLQCTHGGGENMNKNVPLKSAGNTVPVHCTVYSNCMITKY